MSVGLERLAGSLIQQFFLFLEILNQPVQFHIRNHLLFPQVLDPVNLEERIIHRTRCEPLQRFRQRHVQEIPSSRLAILVPVAFRKQMPYQLPSHTARRDIFRYVQAVRLHTYGSLLCICRQIIVRTVADIRLRLLFLSDRLIFIVQDQFGGHFHILSQPLELLFIDEQVIVRYGRKRVGQYDRLCWQFPSRLDTRQDRQYRLHA